MQRIIANNYNIYGSSESYTWETDIRKHKVQECKAQRCNLIFEVQPRNSKVYIFVYDKDQSGATFKIITYVLNKEKKVKVLKSCEVSLRYGPTIWSGDVYELEKENLLASGKVKFGFEIGKGKVHSNLVPDTSSGRCANNEQVSTQQREKNPSLESMSRNFSELFDNEEGSDVTLRCADRLFKAHRCILSVRSFKGDILEREESVIDIEDVTPEILEQTLRYIYSGNVENMNVETAFELYKVAVRYGVGSLKDHCTSFLTENLCQIYACDVLLLADTHTDEQLKNSTMDFMVENCTFLRTDQWHVFCEGYHSLGFKVYQKYARKQIQHTRELRPAYVFREQLGDKRFGGQTSQLASVSKAQPTGTSGEPCDILTATKNIYKSKIISAEEKNLPSLEKMSLDFGKLFDNEKGSDVLIKCADRQIRAHRFILSARSDLFAAMFRKDTRRTGMWGIVTITDVALEILERMLRYIYSGKIEGMTVETAYKLYKASKQYGIASLKNECASFLTENLSQASACDVLLFADTYEDEPLEKSTVDFMTENCELLCTDQWDKFCEEHPSWGIKVYRKFVDKQPERETGLIFRKY